MKQKIVREILSKLQQIKNDCPVYMDSVMQSKARFYFVFSVDEGGTENVGINVQNKAYLVDVAFVDNEETKKSKQMIEELLFQCGSFFNVLTLDENQVFPQDYLAYKSEGIQHVSFTVAFPQSIEWSEE